MALKISIFTDNKKVCPDGGIGRRAGFKIQFPQGSEGSTPSPGTI